MILENAFGYLPEILSGSNYAAQRYEAGIVTAISLAVLQELNARNVPNPLSNICVERLYETAGFERAGDPARRRYLRADLYVDLSRIMVGSAGLARFGWRYRNWLEAKYFRQGKISSTTACAHMAADLIRLCTLVPPECKGKGKKISAAVLDCPGTLSFERMCSGRYFLHVYNSNPEELVGKRRPWIRTLRVPGSHHISLRIGDDKAKKEFIGAISNQLKSITLNLHVTNFCHSQQPGTGGYLCVLSRIDSFDITLDNNGQSLKYEESAGRDGKQSCASALKNMRSLVGSYILLNDKQREESDDEPPTTDEINSAQNDEVDEVDENRA